MPTYLGLYHVLKDYSRNTDEAFVQWCKDGMEFLKPYIQKEKDWGKKVVEAEKR